VARPEGEDAYTMYVEKVVEVHMRISCIRRQLANLIARYRRFSEMVTAESQKSTLRNWMNDLECVRYLGKWMYFEGMEMSSRKIGLAQDVLRRLKSVTPSDVLLCARLGQWSVDR
jgi:hypothetical protein